jgi:hypothetical protein
MRPSAPLRLLCSLMTSSSPAASSAHAQTWAERVRNYRATHYSDANRVDPCRVRPSPDMVESTYEDISDLYAARTGELSERVPLAVATAALKRIWIEDGSWSVFAEEFSDKETASASHRQQRAQRASVSSSSGSVAGSAPAPQHSVARSGSGRSYSSESGRAQSVVLGGGLKSGFFGPRPGAQR